MAKALTSATESTTSSGKTYEKSNVFINVGFYKEVNGEKIFVSLPYGLGLDGMNEARTDTANKDYNNLNAAKNDLLHALLELAEQVAPGTAEPLHGLSLEIRVKAPKAEADGDQNPYLMDKPKLSIG